MPAKLIKDIDEGLWGRFKAAALHRGLSVNAAATAAIAQWCDGDNAKPPPAAAGTARLDRGKIERAQQWLKK